MPFTKGHTINKGRKHSEEAAQNMSRSKQGANNPMWKGGLSKYTCHKCHKHFEAHNRRRKYCSLKCSSWKGDDVGYTALHQWVYRYYGKASRCIACTTGKSFTWANISREYKRDITDWAQLCRSCHTKYDRYGYTLEELKNAN